MAGSRKGIPNKATASAREAIARFVDDNAGRMQEWLDTIANGVPLMRDGQQARDENGNLLWITPPNPTKAFDMVQSVVEYHVPKLARQEHTGPDGGGIVVELVNFSATKD